MHRVFIFYAPIHELKKSFIMSRKQFMKIRVKFLKYYKKQYSLIERKYLRLPYNLPLFNVTYVRNFDVNVFFMR